MRLSARADFSITTNSTSKGGDLTLTNVMTGERTVWLHDSDKDNYNRIIRVRRTERGVYK